MRRTMAAPSFTSVMSSLPTHRELSVAGRPSGRRVFRPLKQPRRFFGATSPADRGHRSKGRAEEQPRPQPQAHFTKVVAIRRKHGEADDHREERRDGSRASNQAKENRLPHRARPAMAGMQAEDDHRSDDAVVNGFFQVESSVVPAME